MLKSGGQAEQRLDHYRSDCLDSDKVFAASMIARETLTRLLPISAQHSGLTATPLAVQLLRLCFGFRFLYS
jgi:hypothetical protein